MSFLDQLLAGGIKGLAEGIGSLAKDIRVAITGQTPLDPNKQAELLLKLQEYEFAVTQMAGQYDLEQMKGQIEIQKIEASSGNIFVSGWRPAVGWVCVLGLLYTYLLKPMIPWIATTWANSWGRVSAAGPLPEVPMGDLIILLAGMLGLAGMRSLEKIKGTGSGK